MATYYDVARLANTMGVKTTIVLDPMKITKRVKNSIKRQLRLGCITGGYRSEAAKIANILVDKYELPVARESWRGAFVNNISMDAKKRILELFVADWAATLLERPEYSNINYYVQKYNQTKIDLESAHTSKFFVPFQNAIFLLDARKVLAESITPEQQQRIENVINNVLDGTNPTHVITYQ